MASSAAAAAAKEKGNAAFKAGQWDVAIGQYTSAIISSGSTPDPTYYLNRAAAYLKLDKYEDAQRDCSSVLRSRPKDVKALFRRAQARIGLGDIKGASQDLRYAEQVEPGNEAVKAELVKLKEKEKPISKPPLAATVKERHPPPQIKPPIRRRIPIEIAEDPPAPSSSAPKAQPTPAIPSRSTSDFLTPVSTTRLTPRTPGSSAQSAVGPTSPGQPATFAAAREAREAKTRKAVGGGIFKKDGTSKIVGSDGRELIEGRRAAEAEPSAPPVHKTNAEQPPAPAISEPAPATASEFIMVFKALPESERWPYLQRVAPDKLPSLFGSALEPDILELIILTLGAIPSPPQSLVLSYLRTLPQISRFGTIRLFLPSKIKAIASQLLNALGADDSIKRCWGL